MLRTGRRSRVTRDRKRTSIRAFDAPESRLTPAAAVAAPRIGPAVVTVAPISVVEPDSDRAVFTATLAATSATGTITSVSTGSAVVPSSDLGNTSGGVEAASGTTEVAASFTSGSFASTLHRATLPRDEATTGTATVGVYTDAGLNPGTLIATLTSPTSDSTTASDTSFTSASGVALAANTTYWLVLTAPSGSFDWSWSTADTGTGVGYTGTWAESTDSGADWFPYTSSPPQFSVAATVA